MHFLCTATPKLPRQCHSLATKESHARPYEGHFTPIMSHVTHGAARYWVHTGHREGACGREGTGGLVSPLLPHRFNFPSPSLDLILQRDEIPDYPTEFHFPIFVFLFNVCVYVGLLAVRRQLLGVRPLPLPRESHGHQA